MALCLLPGLPAANPALACISTIVVIRSDEAERFDQQKHARLYSAKAERKTLVSYDGLSDYDPVVCERDGMPLLSGTPASGTMLGWAPPFKMAPLSANGIADVIVYRSAAGQTLGRSQRVKDVEGLSREVRG